MDSKDFELYANENKAMLESLRVALNNVAKALDKVERKIKDPVDTVKIDGPISIDNPVTDVSVKDLNTITDALDKMGVKLMGAIKDNKPEKIESLKISNPVTEVSVKSLQSLINNLIKAIEDNKPKIKIEKQNLKFPTLAKDAIPVRLSDGKSFYKAVSNLVAAANQSFNNDPFRGYQPTDVDRASSTKYYGYTRVGGYWYIMRENTTDGTYRYAVGAPNGAGGGLYTDAWIDRVNLTYRYYYEVI